MKANQVRQFVEATQGLFFSVVFKKRTTGELRRMICRTGVWKHVTGEGLAFNARDHGLIVVWSADAQGYRMIPAENVVSITFKGEEVRFDETSRG